VFPAYAGVFLSCLRCFAEKSRVPRIRGGVPRNEYDWIQGRMCSPHTRGCSFSPIIDPIKSKVFPAYAGVFRLVATGVRACPRVPRIRGGVPT